MFTWLTTTYLGKLISTFCIAMVPVLELRGAIPIGTGMGLDPWIAFAVSVIGNMVPVPFIILFIRKIFDWMRRFKTFDKLVDKLEAKAAEKGKALVKYEALGLFLLVAIPLPGTGAWTGSLVAAIFDLRLKTAVPVIFAGVVAAGIIVMIVTYGVVAAI